MKQGILSGLSTALLTALILLVLVTGCESEPPGASPTSVTDYNSLVKSLRNAGASVEEGGAISQPFFSVKGRILNVNGEGVQVFEYDSSDKASEEAGRVSPDGSPVGTTMITWVAPPHFYRSGRLVVLYVGEDKAVTSLLEGVLGPQFAGR